MLDGTTELVPSVAIDQLLAQREAFVERVTRAHELLREAEGFGEVRFAGDTRATIAFMDGLDKTIKHNDVGIWRRLYELSGLRSLMDADARAQLEKQLDKGDVPELTRENIVATLRTAYESRDDMFLRGLTNVFRRLSWDYKSNSPVCFGKKMVINTGLNRATFGWSSTYLRFETGNELDDLVRVFSLIENKPEPDHRNGVWQRTRAAGFPQSGDLTLDYFTLKGFKKGSVHVVFTRPDLVEKLNGILAKHYPNALPAHRD